MLDCSNCLYANKWVGIVCHHLYLVQDEIGPRFLTSAFCLTSTLSEANFIGGIYATVIASK